MGLLEGVEMDRLPPPERPAPAVPLPEPAALLVRAREVVETAAAGAAGAGLERVTAWAVTVIAWAEAAEAASCLGVEAGAEGAEEAGAAGVVTGWITSGFTADEAADAAGFAVVAAGLAAGERLEAALLGLDRDLEVAMVEGDGARCWMRGGRRRSRGAHFSRRATSGR